MPDESVSGIGSTNELARPAPDHVSDSSDFVALLRELRSWAGQPSLSRLRLLGGKVRSVSGHVVDALPTSTTSAVLRGNRLPQLPRGEFVAAYVRACLRARDVADDEVSAEVDRWLAARYRLESGQLPTPTAPAPVTAGQEQITSGATTFAPPAAVPQQLPAPPDFFTGRQRELAELTRALNDQPTSAMTVWAITGAGGIGKSWLAIRWAHDMADRFPDGQLFLDLHGYTPAGTPLSTSKALRTLIEALGENPEAVPTDVQAMAAAYRNLTAGRRLLIVLDNARDSAQVDPLLPGSPACVVLVTSRNQLEGLVSTHGARPLPLVEFGEQDAWELIAQRLGANRLAAEPEAAKVLLDQCAGLPLALSVVASRAAIRKDLPLHAVANELELSRLDALDTGDLASNLRAVFAASYHALHPPLARLFRLLGLLDAPDISQPAAASLAGLPLPRARRLLRELCDVHLAHEHSPGRYRMHDLVRTYASELAMTVDTEPDRRQALHRLLDHYVHSAHAAGRLLDPHREPAIAPEPACEGVTPAWFADHDKAMAWFMADSASLLAAFEQAVRKGFDSHVWQLAWAANSFFRLRGRYDLQLGCQQAALAAVERLGNQTWQAHSQRLLARVHTQLGQHDVAETYLLGAFRLYSQAGDRTGQADVQLNLGWLHERQGRIDSAIEQATNAFQLYRAVGNRIRQASALNNIGWCHARLGNHKEALSCCQQALLLHEETGNQGGQAATLDSLGYIHHRRGEPEPAAAAYLQAIAIYRSLDDRYNQAETLVSLGHAHHAAGDVDACRKAWLEALDIFQDLQHADAGPLRAKLCALDSGEGPSPSTLPPSGPA